MLSPDLFHELIRLPFQRFSRAWCCVMSFKGHISHSRSEKCRTTAGIGIRGVSASDSLCELTVRLCLDEHKQDSLRFGFVTWHFSGWRHWLTEPNFLSNLGRFPNVAGWHCSRTISTKRPAHFCVVDWISESKSRVKRANEFDEYQLTIHGHMV